MKHLWSQALQNLFDLYLNVFMPKVLLTLWQSMPVVGSWQTQIEEWVDERERDLDYVFGILDIKWPPRDTDGGDSVLLGGFHVIE